MEVHRSWRGFRGALIALVMVAGAVVALGASPASADAAGQGGDFVPLGNGVRILDTSNGTGTTTGTRGPASTTTVQVLGVGGIPTDGVRAVLVDIATKAPSAATFLTLWAGGAARPAVTTLYANAGEQVSDGAVVEVGANGKINLYNNGGNTHVFIDVQGYFTNSTSASGPGGFVPTPTNPTVLSTAAGIGVPVGTIPAKGSRTVSLLGGVVPAGSPVVFADLQVSGATAAGYVTTAPAGTTGGASNLEFTVGSTSSGTSIRLAADGRATIVNQSTAPISMLIRLQGYFAASKAQGAGLRPKSARLSDTLMAANGTVDVAVGGTNGLPLRSVAGAAINFNAGSPAGSGYFKAWPLGATEPNSSVAVWPTGKVRSGLAVVKPGIDGKIRIKNVSNGTVHLYADLQGWFADPLPNLPTAGFALTTVEGFIDVVPHAIEYSYVDANGQLHLGHQASADDFSSITWTNAPGNEAFTGQPAMSHSGDGTVQVTAQHSDSNIWSFARTAAGGPAWGAGADLGGSMASSPTQVTLDNGTKVVFAVDSDGALWHYRPLDGSPSYWRNLGDQDLVGPVTAVPVPQGVQLFARDTTGAIRTALYTGASAENWTSLGGTGSTDRPAALAWPGGTKMRVVIRAADGSVRTKLRASNGTWPADWSTVGTFTAAGAPAVILDPALARVAVVARGTDGEMQQVFETATNSDTWGTWAPVHPGVADPAATDPSVAEFFGDTTGSSWLIVYRGADNLNRVYTRAPLTAAPPNGPAPEPTFIGRVLPGPTEPTFSEHTIGPGGAGEPTFTEHTLGPGGAGEPTFTEHTLPTPPA